MSGNIVTYHSDNAPAGREWAAYIDMGADYLGVRFTATTEEAAAAKASEFWEKDRAKREENIASREAARIKAAETRAKKTNVNTAYQPIIVED